MKAARIVVLAVAIGAGGVAAMLAGRQEKPAEVKPEAPQIASVDVLVAKTDIAMGQTVSPADVAWQAWPTSAATGNFIRKSERPQGIENVAGTIARSPFVAGEPIREVKLVNAKGSGFMAAILPSGMRAVSTVISPETGAGGFILPNDHVDVMLSRRDRDAEKATGSEVHTSEVVLSNVRVLAIDQNVNVAEKDGQKVVVGKTATLELTPPQAEKLALSQQLGTLSLALRSIADSSETAPANDDDSKRRGGSINIVRFGVGVTTTPR
jgi:pilus assembly protein CpaB